MRRGVADASAAAAAPDAPPRSRLAQWPVEIKLVPAQAPYFAGAHVLVAADCTAFAHADFHRRLMDGKITVIGCPKLDAVDYADKLAEIFASNDVASVTVARMEVPCCGGLEQAARIGARAQRKGCRSRWPRYRRGELLSGTACQDRFKTGFCRWRFPVRHASCSCADAARAALPPSLRLGLYLQLAVLAMQLEG